MIKKIIGILVLSVLIIVGGIYLYASVNKESVEAKEDIKVEESVVAEEEVVKDEIIIENENTEKVNEVTTNIAKGEPAPDFTLVSLNGKEVSLSNFRGKFVLVNFWATWCGFCDMEMPDLQKFSNENDDIVVLAVNVMEEKNIVQEYID